MKKVAKNTITKNNINIPKITFINDKLVIGTLQLLTDGYPPHPRPPLGFHTDDLPQKYLKALTPKQFRARKI